MIKPTYKLRKLSKGLMSITLAGAFMTAPLTPVVTTAFATEVTAPTFPTDVTDANAIAQDYMTNYVNAFLNGGATAANTYSSQWTNWARTFETGTPEDRVTINATNSAAMMLGEIYHVYYNTGYVSLETLDPFTRALYDKIVASNRIWDTDDFKTTTEEVTGTEEEKQPEAIVEDVDVTVTNPTTGEVVKETETVNVPESTSTKEEVTEDSNSTVKNDTIIKTEGEMKEETKPVETTEEVKSTETVKETKEVSKVPNSAPTVELPVLETEKVPSSSPVVELPKFPEEKIKELKAEADKVEETKKKEEVKKTETKAVEVKKANELPKTDAGLGLNLIAMLPFGAALLSKKKRK